MITLRYGNRRPHVAFEGSIACQCTEDDQEDDGGDDGGDGDGGDGDGGGGDDGGDHGDHDGDGDADNGGGGGGDDEMMMIVVMLIMMVIMAVASGGGQGGAALKPKHVFEHLGSFRYRVMWLLLKNHHQDQVRTWSSFRKWHFRASKFEKFLGEHAPKPP